VSRHIAADDSTAVRVDVVGASVQDDEINNQSQLVEKWREQVVELEELIVSHRKESESLQAEQQRVQAENDSAKDEARRVLSALTAHLLVTYLLSYRQECRGVIVWYHLIDTDAVGWPQEVIWHWCQHPSEVQWLHLQPPREMGSLVQHTQKNYVCLQEQPGVHFYHTQ